MSATFDRLGSCRFLPHGETRCRVVSAYEDAACRERVIRLCQHLVRTFWAEIDFRFAWCRFRYLEDAALASAAAAQAAQAELLLFATTTRQEPPSEVRNWVESWTVLRRAGTRAMLVLMEGEKAEEGHPSVLEAYLGGVAERAGMDFLSSPRAMGFESVPDALRQMQRRASQLSPILEGLLRRPMPSAPPPSTYHWGINE